MIREILKRVECYLTKRYSRLYLEHSRVVELYNHGGITKTIANKELYQIYSRMRFYKNISRYIVTIKVKLQSILIGI